MEDQPSWRTAIDIRHRHDPSLSLTRTVHRAGAGCRTMGGPIMPQGALSTLRVIEFADFISGPYCGRLMADLGTDVVKVEQPGAGDPARRSGPFPGDVPHPEKSLLFAYLNTNKK